MASDSHDADSVEEVTSAASAEDVLGGNREGARLPEPEPTIRLATQGGDRDFEVGRLAESFWLHDLVRQSD